MTVRARYASLVESQRCFFETHETKKIDFRIQQLKKLYHAIEEFAPQLTVALYADLHRSEMEAWAHEVGLCLNEISSVIRNLRRWARSRKTKGPKLFMLSSASIVNEPYGVTLIIGPWNYPLLLVVMPLIGAIAAGNCAVVKPSELTTECESVLREMFGRHFDEQYISVVTGDAATVTDLLKQKFDYVFYTGSERVGRIIMAAAAAHLTPVTLELGGKSPCIIDRDCNLEQTVRRVAWGKFINAGQVCVAPDYLLVPKEMVQETVEKLKRTIARFYGKNPRISEDYGRIVNKRHFERLSGYLKEGTVVCGGDTVEEELYIAPTVLLNCETESRVMTEEIFGPVLPVVPYDNLEKAIVYVNRRPKPLALYFFSGNGENVKKIINETSSGNVAINDTVIQIIAEALPYGGVGASGTGKYHGEYSYRTFSNTKSIVKNPVLYDIPRFPPYRPWNLKLIKMFYR
jgi:acyl-CoA reductase-like NAD-dependent aldehyde dehydrogenase